MQAMPIGSFLKTTYCLSIKASQIKNFQRKEYDLRKLPKEHVAKINKKIHGVTKGREHPMDEGIYALSIFKERPMDEGLYAFSIFVYLNYQVISKDYYYLFSFFSGLGKLIYK
eukprot:TRINITY_DN11166_c2_g1_i1.p1 TRINITY_DN11166_c2_g1~~TRINITY_DN11166_c2_g1_i1.p1  ORF type:complete len:113 (-),score=12.20 TRINITY_DN11166_c2_g1_i1:1078-1416(-)